MPTFDPTNEKMKSQIIKRLRDQINLDAIKDLGTAQGGTQFYAQIDEHLKTGAYIK